MLRGVKLSKEAEDYANELCIKCPDEMYCHKKCQEYKYSCEVFDAGVESEKKKVEWHNLKENPNDLPPAQDYEIKESIDHWKWYLVKTDYTDYKSCQYAVCARVLMPRYSDGVAESIWKENSGNDIGDEHIFEWREL